MNHKRTSRKAHANKVVEYLKIGKNKRKKRCIYVNQPQIY